MGMKDAGGKGHRHWRVQEEKMVESERSVPVKEATFLADMPRSVCEFWSPRP